MKDTPADVEKLYREMLMKRSGEVRLRMSCRMFDTARALILASLAEAGGTDSEAAAGSRCSCVRTDAISTRRRVIASRLD